MANLKINDAANPAHPGSLDLVPVAVQGSDGTYSAGALSIEQLARFVDTSAIQPPAATTFEFEAELSGSGEWNATVGANRTGTLLIGTETNDTLPGRVVADGFAVGDFVRLTVASTNRFARGQITAIEIQDTSTYRLHTLSITGYVDTTNATDKVSGSFQLAREIKFNTSAILTSDPSYSGAEYGLTAPAVRSVVRDAITNGGTGDTPGSITEVALDNELLTIWRDPDISETAVIGSPLKGIIDSLHAGQQRYAIPPAASFVFDKDNTRNSR